MFSFAFKSKQNIFTIFSTSFLIHAFCPSYFLISVLLFAIAHIIYIYSFGFKPLRFDLFILIMLVHVCSCLYFVPYLKIPTLKIALPAYVTLLLVMVWRSMSRVNLKHIDSYLLAGALGKYFHSVNFLKIRLIIFPYLGAILFGLSDLILCYNAFVQTIPFANFVIMFTYYYAQFGLALTVLSTKTKNS